ncbi:MAG: hypothetical protein IPL74_00875 [Bacteroidetes bacterium]|nr:hypothetical protein [Bacteroidota bacterium]
MMKLLQFLKTSGNYTSTTWTPTSVLYTNAGGTSPYSGGNNPNVFLRSTTPGNVDVILTATDGICTEVDTVTVFINRGCNQFHQHHLTFA